MSRAGHGEVREWLGEREESDLNDVGPKNDLAQVRPVRPVACTGQTGPAQADRRCLVLCFAVSLKLMTLINLITKD